MRPFHNDWDREKQGKLYNITIRNLTAHSSPGRIMGYDKDHCVKNVVFENLVIRGKKIKRLDQTQIKTNKHIKKILFK